jgi:hypothetical protein
VQNNGTSQVFYHKKGRNNLAETYSIFSAEVPVRAHWLDMIPSYAYKEKSTYVNFQDAYGTPYYQSESDHI